MKKIKFLSLLLTLCVIFQCMAAPVFAADAAPIPATTSATEATEPTEPPFGTVSIQEGCRTIEGMVPLGGNERRLDTAVSAFAYEVTTGTVVYSYNPDIKVSPGTLAKIVNALVVVENANLDDTVVVRDAIQSRVPGSSHRLKPQLKSGEQLSVRDLLYGMILDGANDAAVALAEHVAGTTEAFKLMMNQRVLQMGCTSTEFGNISGLDTATNVSTARDMAKIVKEAIKNETFAEVFGTRTYTIPATNLTEEREEMRSDNYLIDEGTIPQFMNSNITGGMASATDASGASIACTGEYRGMKVVFVVLGCTRVLEDNGWQVRIYGNFEEVTELIKYVFNNFKVNKIIYDGMAVNQWAVAGGESHVVGQSTVDVDSVVPKDASMDNLIMKYNVVDKGLSAPIRKDDLIATVSIWFRNSCLTEVELFAMGDVKAAANSGVTVHGNAVNAGGGGFLSVLGTICVIVLCLAIVYLAFNAYMRTVIRNRRRRRRAERKRSR